MTVTTTLNKALSGTSKSQCSDIFEILLVLEGGDARVLVKTWEEAQRVLAKWAEQACQGQSNCQVKFWLETDEIITIGFDLWELWGLCFEKFEIELQNQILVEFAWLNKRIIHKLRVKNAAKKLYTQRVFLLQDKAFANIL